MTNEQIKDRDAFTTRWLSVLNSEDASNARSRRIIIAAMTKEHGASNDR